MIVGAGERHRPQEGAETRGPRIVVLLPACQATSSLALPTGASVRIGWPSITTVKPAVRHRLTSDPGPPSRQLSPNSRAPCQARERVNARALRSDPTYAAGCGRHRVRDALSESRPRNQSSRCSVIRHGSPHGRIRAQRSLRAGLLATEIEGCSSWSASRAAPSTPARAPCRARRILVLRPRPGTT